MNVLFRINKALNIEAGETRQVWLMILLGFLIGVTSNITQVVTYSTFLMEFSSKDFAWVFIANTIVVSIISLSLVKLSRKFSFSKILILNMGFLLAMQVALRLSFGLSQMRLLPARGIVFALPVYFEAFYALSGLLFWNLANQMFTIRQGKRVFGLFSGGRMAALVLSGFMVPLFIRWMGMPTLLNITIVSLIGAFILLVAITREYGSHLESPVDALSQQEKKPGGLTDLFKNRYIVMIFGLVAISECFFYLLENVYFNQAALRFTDLNRLASFTGFFSAIFGLLTLFLSIFFTRRWLNRFGVRGGVLILPAMLVASTASLAVAGALTGQSLLFFGLVVLNKLINEPGSVAIDRPALSLLYQPLPRRQRAETQTIAEGVFFPAAVGLAGVLLLILTGPLKLNATGLAWALAFTAIGWILVASGVTRQFPARLLEALFQRKLVGADLTFSDDASLAVLRGGLRSTSPRTVIYAIELLEQLGDQCLPEELAKLLAHPQEEVRARALETIRRLGLTGLLQEVCQQVLLEETPIVRGVGLQTLAVLGGAEQVESVAAYLHDPSTAVRLGALTGLLQSGTPQGVSTAVQSLQQLANSPRAEDRLIVAQAINENQAGDNYPILAQLIGDGQPEVRKAALLAAGRTQDPRYWPLILPDLCDPGVRKAAVAALAASKETFILELPVYAQEASRNADYLSGLVQVCGNVGGERAIAWLENWMTHPLPALRTPVYRALSQCGYHPGESKLASLESCILSEVEAAARTSAAQVDLGQGEGLELAQDLLEDRFCMIRERVTLLLSFLYDTLTVMQSRAYLESTADASSQGKRNPSIDRSVSLEKNAFALEVFESLLPLEQRRQIMPILEGEQAAERLLHLEVFFPQTMLGREGRLGEILSTQAGEPNLRAAALFAIGALRMESFGKQTLTAISDPHPLVRETALWTMSRADSKHLQTTIFSCSHDPDPQIARVANWLASAGHASGGDTPMLSTIEKVLFLKSVELFEHVPFEAMLKVAQATYDVAFQEGEELIHQGDRGDSLFFIVEGEVNVFLDSSGKIDKRSESEVIGEMAVLSNRPRIASCVAATPVHTLKIERDDFWDLLEETPQLVFGIIQVLLRRLEASTQRSRPLEEGPGNLAL